MCNSYMSLCSHLLVETYIACTLVVYKLGGLTLPRPIVHKSYRNIRKTKLTMRNYINRDSKVNACKGEPVGRATMTNRSRCLLSRKNQS